MLQNCLLRDLTLESVPSNGIRRIEVIATGLPLFGGIQLAVDATLVSAVKADGTAQPRAERSDGVRLEESQRHTERKYPELLEAQRCKLVVAAMEVGGRWSEESYFFLDTLAQGRAAEAPKALRESVFQACKTRWARIASSGRYGQLC